mgnify:CR=1 FL=1
MSGTEQEQIAIRASASHNSLTFCIGGIGVILLGASMIMLLPELLFLAGVLLSCLGVVGLIIGVFKRLQPPFSLLIDKQGIRYQHRRGSWYIAWSNIQRIDIPRVHQGLNSIDLSLIGFRLKQPDLILPDISPRLTTYLLMEQRPLLRHMDESQCATGKCYGDDLIDDQKYKLDDGTQLKGVHAMFANRMRRLRQSLGYDIYLNANEFDRPLEDCQQLLNDCLKSVQSSQPN